jgi:integrase
MTETAWKRLLESYLFDMNLEYGNIPKNMRKYSPEKIPLTIDPFSWHCLRHTFCTLMYNAGVDVLTAKEQMGHSDVKTTLSIYTHLQNENKQRNIDKLDLYLTEK